MPLERRFVGDRQITDTDYAESRSLPVASLANEPEAVAHQLLDRLYVSFVVDGQDVIADVLAK